jgi:hypothetical protein
MVSSIKNAAVKDVLKRNKTQLVSKAALSETVLQNVTEERLISWGLLEGDAILLKSTYPTSPSRFPFDSFEDAPCHNTVMTALGWLWLLVFGFACFDLTL